ncbi:MAG: STAS domain-containing protein [bacterium]
MVDKTNDVKTNIVRTKNKLPVNRVAPEGEVDLYSSPKLRKKLIELTEAQTRAILVDLSNVKYMDSSGVATLVEALQKVGKYGGKLKIASLRAAVKDVFELSRLDKVFDIYDTTEDALEAFDEYGTSE